MAVEKVPARFLVDQRMQILALIIEAALPGAEFELSVVVRHARAERHLVVTNKSQKEERDD